MGRITKFTDLEVWQEAHQLVILTYHLTEQFPQNETFGLTSQLRRATISITSNIAEGFSRYHYKDRLRFYYDARGSISEVQSQLYDANGVKLVTDQDFKSIIEKTEHIHLLLNGLIRKTASFTNISLS